MFISSAMSAVVTCGSPSRLKSARLVARMRSRVRRGGFSLPRMRARCAVRPVAVQRRAAARARAAMPRSRWSSVCDEIARRLRARCARRRVRDAAAADRSARRSIARARIGEALRARSAMPCRASSGASVGARAARLCARRGERERAQPLALRVAEDAGEEHVGVLARRLEQQRCRRRGYCARVLLHADLHARVDDRAERLRQHERQAAAGSALPRVVRRRARARRVASNGTSGLTQNSRSTPSSSATRRVQRLVERAVDVVLAVDLDRREQSRAARSTPRSRARSARGRVPARRT